MSERGFTSYFLTFEDSARLELYAAPIFHTRSAEHPGGYAHIAISVGSKQKVLILTKLPGNDRYLVIGEPGTTGDGYLESAIEDSDARVVAYNRVVFNLMGNKYLLLVRIVFNFKAIQVKWFGTHAEYAKINVTTIQNKKK